MKVEQAAKSLFLTRIHRRLRPVDALFLQAEGDAQLSAREESAIAALSRRACAAPLSQRRGTLHRLQALRGDLPGPGDHHRGRSAPQRRHAAHHALRHRHGEMHLLRLLPGSLPGRRHRRGAEFRIRGGDARGTLSTTSSACSTTAHAGSARSRATSRSTRRIGDWKRPHRGIRVARERAEPVRSVVRWRTGCCGGRRRL